MCASVVRRRSDLLDVLRSGFVGTFATVHVRSESLSGARSSVGGGNSSIGSVFTARAVPCECLLGAKKTHPARGKV